MGDAIWHGPRHYDGRRNRDTVLVADFGKDRVVEIDPTTSTIVWKWENPFSTPWRAVEAAPVVTARAYVPLAMKNYAAGW